ncbi:MAG: cation diffusion facilitator family transporter [Cuniculiplasma sp.]
MENGNPAGRKGRAAIANALYWVLFLGFLLSFISSRNALSMALASDRIVDAAGMTIALASYSIVQLPPTGRLTYGYHRFESLSSVLLIMAFILLLIYTVIISTPEIYSSRIHSPLYTIYSSALSLLLLPMIALLLHGDENLTTKTMSVHTLQDIFTTALALGGSLILIFYPSGFVLFLFAIVIVIVSIVMNWGVLTRNIRLLMEGTDLNTVEIESSLKQKFPMVHHLHIWDVCKHYRIATVHVYAANNASLLELEPMRREIDDYLIKYGVNHLTLQFEPSQWMKH